MDPILVMSVFVRRYLHCVVGEVIYDNYKKLGFFLNLLGSVKAERFIASPKFINECNDILQHNGVIQIYPEGRLPTKMEHDKILPFKVSVALLSIQSNAPIIPIYHTGKYGAGKTQTVVIGKPINLRDHCSELNPSPEKLKALTKIIEDKVIQLKLMIPNETKEENK
jgi:1-acyl-sn-glycerol-3-phosphate acyltransferase